MCQPLTAQKSHTHRVPLAVNCTNVAQFESHLQTFLHVVAEDFYLTLAINMNDGVMAWQNTL